MEANTIELRKERGAWVADFIGDDGMVELFGTTCIPTAFTDAAPEAQVVAAIQRKNPLHKVYVKAVRPTPEGKV